jgi:hypothetical protein
MDSCLRRNDAKKDTEMAQKRTQAWRKKKNAGMTQKMK